LTESLKRAARAFFKAILWPIARFFDPRFQGLSEQASVLHDDLVQRLDTARVEFGEERRAERQAAVGRHEDTIVRVEEIAQLQQTARAEQNARMEQSGKVTVEAVHSAAHELRLLLEAEMDAASQATELIGRSLADLLGETGALNASLADLRKQRSSSLQEAVATGSVEGIDANAADFLNYATSHRGFAAQRNLWFNPPIAVQYQEGEVLVSGTNERIVETPYAFRALAQAPPPARVLDVGATENTLAFSLAALGYEVTALDLRAYPLKHPRLRTVVAPVQEWETDESFDAVLCLSTIEHIGLGAYGEPSIAGRADLKAMERMRTLTRQGGLLVLTAPFGRASAARHERAYDREALDALLDGWDVEDLTVVRQENSLTWIVEEDSVDDADGETRCVVLVTARHAE
jgi:hypothetical protein